MGKYLFLNQSPEDQIHVYSIQFRILLRSIRRRSLLLTFSVLDLPGERNKFIVLVLHPTNPSPPRRHRRRRRPDLHRLNRRRPRRAIPSLRAYHPSGSARFHRYAREEKRVIRRDPRPRKKMSSEMGKSKNKRAMAAGPEEGQAKKMNPGQEEEDKKDSPALLPMPGGRHGCFIDPRWLTAKIAKDKLDAAKSAPIPPVKIPTLEHFKPPTRFHTRALLPVRESGSKAALSAAKSLVGISSSLDIGSKPLKRCSGLLIDWDEESKTCVVLTTAHLIRTKDSPVNVWLGGEEYTSNADVTVHLLDGTSEKGQLLYYQPHYDLAFVRVKVDQPIQLPSFNEEVTFAEEVLRLGRDNMLDLRITYGRAAYQNPDIDERYHYMYFDCADDVNDDDEYDSGGLVISLDGKIVGMFNISSRGSFIPSSILLSCVDLWKKYGRIPRPQLGMTFEAIKLLEPAHVDKIWRMCHIDDGLIVQEVLKGSPADKFGIERGDIVECFNGEPISNTVELENRLLNTCKGLSDNYNDLIEVHVSVGVFHMLKKQRRIGELTASVSDLGEVIARGSRKIS